ncbi:VOC family protein [Pedobacter sp.]|uniref:VOC family protein n=1 Tax=Pedobacter sp. TaxID=1411316 RepID=UPI003D7F8445
MESLSPNMYVNDVNSTMQFYNLIGFKSVMTVPENGEEPIWAMMQNGNVTLMFESFKNIEDRLPEISRQDGGSLLLYIKVKDINSFFDSIKDHVTVLHGLQKTFYGATEFTIKDCNGYVLTFAD